MPTIMNPSKTMELPERLWTVEDTAKFLRCTQKHIYKLIDEGLPHYWAGRYLFNPRELFEWIAVQSKKEDRKEG
jgi:hypothetical protein